MDNLSRDSTLNPWHDLQNSLPDAFTAQARGLFSENFDLLRPDGEKFGHLDISGADFEAGENRGTIESESGGYRMRAGNTETLFATHRRFSGTLNLAAGDRSYEARINYLRNSASAWHGRENVALLSSSLSGRSYRAQLNRVYADSLPVAIFLLFYAATSSKRVYLARQGRGVLQFPGR